MNNPRFNTSNHCMKHILTSCFAGVLAVGLTAMGAETIDTTKLPSASAKQVDFVKDIKPLFEKSCFGCHGAKPRAKAKYFMNNREKTLAGGSSKEKAVIAGKGDQSPLLHFSADLVEEMEMPPLDKRDNYPKLTKDQLALVRAWIDQGAKWPEGVELKAAP